MLAVLAIAVLTGCGGGPAPNDGTADVATATLGGYSFGPTSNVLTHPSFSATATTPKWVGKGFGEFSGKQTTVSTPDGGLVKGVKTLKMTVSIPGISTMYFWLAQDSQKNIHYLKAKDGPDPVRLTGVAAGLKPWFLLPRPADTTDGRTWYEYASARQKIRQNKICSTSATYRGKGGLVWLRDIRDNDGDGFEPAWTGDDGRHDLYLDPTGHGLWGIALSATGGYVGKAPTAP
ncbi:MAG: hypothetical protein FJX75_24005 [Armatimonadetes bacterium]|nr:hypothetical protein [Armatimonadota bacterium]